MLLGKQTNTTSNLIIRGARIPIIITIGFVLQLLGTVGYTAPSPS